jgi:hypothetical protein
MLTPIEKWEAEMSGAPQARYLVISLATLSVEAAIYHALWLERLSIFAYFCVHAAVVLAIVALAFVTPAGLRRVTFSALLQLAFWTAVAGPFGAMIAISLAACWRATSAYDQDVGEWLDKETSIWRQKSDKLNSGLLDRRLRIEGADRTTALVDVFLEGSRGEKFEALNVIGRAFEPSLELALRMGMRDPDPAVRVLASTVIAKLQTNASKRMATLREAAIRRVNAADAWREAADAHADYAASGLVTAYQANEHICWAIDYMSRALSHAPMNEAVRLRLAELLIEDRRYRQAIEALDFNWAQDSEMEKAAELRQLALKEVAATASGDFEQNSTRDGTPDGAVASAIKYRGAASPACSP